MITDRRRAEAHRLQGCHPRAAWGRAAAEWPELSARRLLDIYLVWKTATGNLERRSRRFREVRCAQRAQLQDVANESCMLVEQAPPCKTLRSLIPAVSASGASPPSGNRSVYVAQVLMLQAMTLRLWETMMPRRRSTESSTSTRGVFS